jgi:hypothetical protein
MPSNVVASERSEFRNISGHVIGVVTRRDNNNMKSLALMPDDSIWLDEEEQIATANAPRYDEDNPFENGDLELVTKAEQILNRRRIGYTKQPQVRAPEADAEPPEEGTEGEPDAEEESDPAGSGGSPEEAPTAPPEGQGDDDPPVPQKVKSPQRADTPMDEAQEANAKAHAARAVASPAPEPVPPKPPVPAKATTTAAPEKPAVTTEKPAAAPQGKRAPTEEIATPEAEGK